MIRETQISRRPWLPVLLFAVICCVGVLGYWFLEPDWSLLDALFMTFITLTTVGYSDYDVSQAGRIFTLILLFAGIGSFTYALAVVTTYLVEGHFKDNFRRKRMEKKIRNLTKHCIVCGLGDTGRYIVEEFQKVGQKFVVVETDAGRIEELYEREPFLYVQGDATDDRVLREAGIANAERLIATLQDDKDNLFVVLSARRLNAALRIIAKVVNVAASREKIKLAGADEVVSPEAIGGLRMASLALRPQVVTFLDLMLREGSGTRFEEAEIGPGSRLVGKTIGESKIREQIGLLVVALRHGAVGQFVYNPGAEIALGRGDILYVIGDAESVKRLRKAAGSAV